MRTHARTQPRTLARMTRPVMLCHSYALTCQLCRHQHHHQQCLSIRQITNFPITNCIYLHCIHNRLPLFSQIQCDAIPTLRLVVYCKRHRKHAFPTNKIIVYFDSSCTCKCTHMQECSYLIMLDVFNTTHGTQDIQHSVSRWEEITALSVQK